MAGPAGGGRVSGRFSADGARCDGDAFGFGGAGLLVAIPAMAMAKIFEARVDKLVHDLNEVTSHLREWYFSTPKNDE